jgi:hypothetical protein
MTSSVVGAKMPVSPVSATSSAVADALSQSLTLLADIEIAIRTGELRKLHTLAEALRGPITSVLAREAFEAAGTLEKTMSDEDLFRARDAHRRLQDAINSLVVDRH